MATVVFIGFPGQGHVIPSLPIIAELVRRGERVIYFETEPFQTAVEQTGAVFRAYGAAFPLAAPQTLARFSKSTHTAIALQLETSEWVLSHLLPEIQALTPDYVMYDSLCSWGWYVSQILAKPAISFYPTLVFNYKRTLPPSLSRRLKNLVRDAAELPTRLRAKRLSRQYHVSAPVRLAQLMHSEGALNLVLTSREFQPDAEAFDPARFKFIGPAVTPRSDAPAFPFEWLDGRPLILVSLGTAYNNQPAFYKMCLEALGGTPWQIVMATGTEVILPSQELAENVLLRPMVPQLELLKRTTVFITHGGMNSVNEALYFDVPLIVVPQGADQGWIAGCVRAVGAGILLDKLAIDAQTLRQAVETILRNSAYAEAAKRIGATLRATSGAVGGADAIFAFMGAHETE